MDTVLYQLLIFEISLVVALSSVLPSQKRTVEMDPVKVSGVSKWPEPQNKREVQSFVGFINFYQQFIKDVSHHACALFNLTKKDVGW